MPVDEPRWRSPAARSRSEDDHDQRHRRDTAPHPALGGLRSLRRRRRLGPQREHHGALPQPGHEGPGGGLVPVPPPLVRPLLPRRERRRRRHRPRLPEPRAVRPRAAQGLRPGRDLLHRAELREGEGHGAPRPPALSGHPDRPGRARSGDRGARGARRLRPRRPRARGSGASGRSSARTRERRSSTRSCRAPSARASSESRSWGDPRTSSSPASAA